MSDYVQVPCWSTPTQHQFEHCESLETTGGETLSVVSSQNIKLIASERFIQNFPLVKELENVHSISLVDRTMPVSFKLSYVISPPLIHQVSLLLDERTLPVPYTCC